jgi:lycopene beta-cyclase
VRRADLRRVVLGFLRACPHFRVVEGHVEAVRDRGDTAEAIVDGEAVHASWIFDSTGGPGGEADVDARLAFTGYEIATSRSVFDPETPVLFDFRTPQVAGARFGYVLPDGSSRALVELTEFVPRHGEPPSEPERRAALETYIRDVVGTPEYTIRRTESAVVPLRVRPGARGRGRVLCIGARGGLIKATTGYAYQRIQRDSEAIADSLARHGHPWDISGSLPRHRLLDAILLAVLDREPAQLEHAFARLFARNPGARILRFLDEDTGVRDEARLVRSLSPGPFVRAASSQAFRRRQAAGR